MTAELRAIEPEDAGESVVETIERALSLAKEGKLSSVAVVMVHRDGCGQQIWSVVPSIATLIGSASRLVHKLNLIADQ